MFLDILKTIFLGIVEGITEWLPVSSTGHLILADEFIQLGVSDAFKEMFDVVIQLGAILAVVVIFWNTLWPFQNDRRAQGLERWCRMDVWQMWFRVFVAVLPSVVLGLPLDDWLTEHFHNPPVIAVMLILYGVLFIWMENTIGKQRPRVKRIDQINYRIALFIGVFQVLSLIPGTSRSGATILGAMLIGCSRTIAAEFTFFLAVPTMFDASLLKIAGGHVHGLRGVSGVHPFPDELREKARLQSVRLVPHRPGRGGPGVLLRPETPVGSVIEQSARFFETGRFFILRTAEWPSP